MAKLAEILANKRDDYMISVLEESTSELESLKTKKYLTENLNLIGKVLMEEGVVDAAKANLANNWGKYAAGAGVVGAGTLAGEAIAHPDATGQMASQVFGQQAGTDVTNALQNAQDGVKTAADYVADGTNNTITGAENMGTRIAGGAEKLYNDAGTYLENGANDAKRAIINTMETVPLRATGGNIDTAVQNGINTVQNNIQNAGVDANTAATIAARNAQNLYRNATN